MFEVTILILTYNSSWKSLKRTIESVLSQENVCFQIVIADDGSKEDYMQKAEEYFKLNNFKFYVLVKNKENAGTVKNTISGLKQSKGRYTKLISPGDRLLKKDTLKKWVDFVDGHEWSFSDAIYCDVYENVITKKSFPQNTDIYIKGSDLDKRWNYVVVGDIALGAATIGKTDLILNYCERLSNGGVKLAEDNIWRLMMFDGLVGQYYPEKTIIYEYGSGISTCKNSKMKVKLKEDWKNTNKIMNASDEFQEKMVSAISATGLKKVFVRGKLKYKFFSMIKKRMAD